MSPKLTRILTGFLIGIFLVACAPKNVTKHYIKDCVLPDDQIGTYIGRWKLFAVPIALQAGVFGSDEAQAITAAIDNWNDFFSYSMGLPSLDYGGNASSPRTVSGTKPTNPCTSGIIQNGKFTGSVVIYKQSPWPYTSSPQAIAFTSTCKTGSGTLVPNIFMQTMELNYQYFFSDGQRQPDLQSIVFHELGHVLGLDHSCEMTTKAGFPNCNSANLNPDYYAALMYPVFGFDSMGFGEQKRALNNNDQGRMNCLYQGSISSAN